MGDQSKKKHLLTAALPYANGPIHIGHLAGAYLPADIYARFLRAKGEEVLFVCGSDEHGAAITLRAQKEGKSPKEIVDQFHQLNKSAFENFGISFDIFHRTSSDLHHQTAQEFFKVLEGKGAFTKETNQQFYDEDYGQFLADRYISGSCPKCGHDGAYGDQCEACGAALSPKELINPISTLSGKTPVLKETTHWYLPMQKHEKWMKDWIEQGILEGESHHAPEEWRKHVIGQCKSWIDGGLQSRAMSRDLSWGVKVPLKDAEGKVLYVWLDAPIGYISATKAWAEAKNENWESYWKDPSTEVNFFIGKDNIVFHCIIFPILLKIHGTYNLPNNVIANEFLNLEGQKISTSRNWAVWLHEYLEDFPGKEDVLRYVLCSIAPETKDSEFTWEDFQARNNNELVAIYGNFINRATVLVHKYFAGKVPEVPSGFKIDPSLVEKLEELTQACSNRMNKKQFREAQTEAMGLARLGNKFLADSEPWKKIKTQEEEVKYILNTALQIAANAAIALSPFLPDSSEKLARILGLNSLSWHQLGKFDLVKTGFQLKKPELLFQKIESDEVDAQIEKLKQTGKPKSTEKQEVEKKPLIEFEDFSKLELKLGTVKSAEKIKKSKKLLKLIIDIGEEERTIVSGISEFYSPEEIIGKQVQVLTNLAAKKIMGIASQGMILMAEDQSKQLHLLQADKIVENGSSIG